MSRDPQLFDMSDYREDWDSKEHRQRKASSGRQDAGRKQNGQNGTGQGRQDGYRQSEYLQWEDLQEEPVHRGNVQEENWQRENRQGERMQKANNRRENPSEKGGRRKRRKKSKFRKFLITLVVLVALLAGGMYYVVGLVYNKMNYEEITSLTSAPIRDEGVVNILLIGNDSRTGGEDGRSDAMILLSVNNKTGKIYMTSLLRDMYVEIPGYKGNRLNAAYSYGGAELLMATIEQNFDIEVNRYVLVNFEAFANLVDAVDGVDLELTKEEIEYVNGYLVEYNILTGRPEGTDYMDTSAGGMVHLNGPQALAYSRNRYLGTDFGRTERQRKILSAVMDKLPKALITNPKELINGLLPNLTTNLTQGECYRLCFTAAGALTGYELVQGSIPMEGTYSNATIRDMAVLEVDFEANKQYIQDTIYGKKE